LLELSISPVTPLPSEFKDTLPESTMNTERQSETSSKSSDSPRSPLELTEKFHSPVTPSLSEFEEVMNVEQRASPTSMESMLTTVEENRENYTYVPRLQKKKKKKKEK